MALSPYVVGAASAAPNVATTLAAAVSTAPSAGDCLAAWVTTTATGTGISGVSDPVNGSWTAVGSPELYSTGSGAEGQWFILPNCQALTTSQSVTATYGSTGGAKTIQVIGCSGIATSPLDSPGSVVANGTSATATATTGTLAQAAELVLAGTVSAGTGGSPSWSAPFTKLGTDQHNTSNPWASVAYDSVTATTALSPAAAITSANWAIATLALKATSVAQTGVYVAGTATAGTGSTTLAVPVTAATSAGDLIAVATEIGTIGGAAVTGITDTKGNKYSQVVGDNAQEALAVWAATASGGVPVGATVQANTYTTTLGDDLTEAGKFDGFVGGRPMARVMQKRFTNPEGGWYWTGLGTGAAAQVPSKIKALLSAGIPVILSFKPWHDPNGNYTGNTPGGNTFANEYTKLTQALSDLNAIRGSTPLRGHLWSECNNAQQPFGTAAAYAAYVGFFGPAFVAAGIPLDYDPGMGTSSTAPTFFPDAFQKAFAYTATSASPAVFTATGSTYSNGMPVQLVTGAPTGFSNGTTYYTTGVSGATFSLAATPGGAAINSTSTGSGNLAGKLMAGVWVDYYASAYFNPNHPSSELLNPTGTTIDAVEAKADQYGLPFGVAELGVQAATYVPTTAQVVNWLTAPKAQGGQILSRFQARVAAGKPSLGVLWWGSPGSGNVGGPGATSKNVISASSDPALVAAIEQVYDSLLGSTSVPLTTTDTVTVTWASSTGPKLVQVMGIPGLATAQPIDATAAAHNAAGTGTAVSVTSGTLAQNGEVLLAVAGFPNGGTSITWTAPFTAVGTTLHVTSAAFLGVATNTVTATTAQTAAGTLGVSAQWGALIAGFRQAASSSVLILTLSLPPGTVGSRYAGAAIATGGTAPYTYSVSAGSLNAGLSLNTATGQVTGTPTAAGTSSFTVTVTDSASHTASQVTSITVTTAPPAILTPFLPDGAKGVAYSQTLAVVGGTAPFTWSIVSGAQPTGLTLSTGGVLSGTPTAFGTFTFTVQVSDNAALTDQITYVINIPVLAWVNSALPPGSAGQLYEGILSVVGGAPPYTWSVSSGALPAGLALGPAAGAPADTSQQAVTGTPAAAGVYSFTIQATDSASTSISQAFTMQVFVTITIPPIGTGPWQIFWGPCQPTGGITAEVIQAQSKTVTLRTEADQAHEVSFDVDGRSAAAIGITELQTDLIVMFAGQIVFCGRIGPTADNLDASQHRTTISAFDYREVLRRRAVLTGDTLSWTSTDAGLIAWNMIQGTQGRAGGNLGIARGKGATTSITRTFGPVNVGDYIGDNITALAQLAPGFEWQVAPYGMADLRLDLYPSLQGTDRGVVLAYGDARISSITRTVDPSTFANSVYVTSSVGSLTPQNPQASDIGTRPEGRWDSVVGTDDATIQTLQDHATALLNQAQVVTPSYQITFYPEVWADAGGPNWLWLGDPVTVQIDSGRLQVNNPGLRVVEMAFAISPDNTETLTATIGQIPFRPGKKIAAILKRLRYLETR